MDLPAAARTNRWKWPASSRGKGSASPRAGQSRPSADSSKYLSSGVVRLLRAHRTAAARFTARIRILILSLKTKATARTRSSILLGPQPESRRRSYGQAPPNQRGARKRVQRALESPRTPPQLKKGLEKRQEQLESSNGGSSESRSSESRSNGESRGSSRSSSSEQDRSSRGSRSRSRSSGKSSSGKSSTRRGSSGSSGRRRRTR